jgi:hypothetical protein
MHTKLRSENVAGRGFMEDAGVDKDNTTSDVKERERKDVS